MKCGVCKKGELVPSGCGCDNRKCSNHTRFWAALKAPNRKQPEPEPDDDGADDFEVDEPEVDDDGADDFEVA
jgi:hypothetical protein